MRVVLQAGMHKNGNSSFTVSLHATKEKLKQAGFWVIPRGTRTNPGQPKLFDPDWIVEQLDQARHNGAHVFLIAHEALSLCEPEELAKLRAILGPDPVTYVTVLRHWTKYLPSRWAQNCRTFDTQSIFAYMNTVLGDPTRKDHALHHTLTRGFSAGMENPVIVSFENALAHNGIVPAIWKACGLPIDHLTATAKSEWQAKQVGTTQSDLMRLFNGLRPVSDFFSANPMADRHANGFFEFSKAQPVGLVPELLTYDRELIAKLETLLTESSDRLCLTSEAFQAQAQVVQDAVAPYLSNPINGQIWPDPKRVEVTASRLEIEDIPADLRDRMRATYDAIT